MSKEFYQLLEPLLTIGKFLGFPVPNKDGNVSKSKIRKGLSLFYSVLMTLVSFTSLLAAILKWYKRLETSWKLDGVWRISYYFASFSTYSYFLLKRRALGSLLRKWSSMDYFIQIESKNSNFVAVCVSVFAMCSTAILETICFDVDVSIQELGGFKGATFMEKYFDVTFYKYEAFQSALSYHPRMALSVAIYIFSKLSTVATDYGDSFCVILCFGLSSRLQSFNEYLKQKLLERELRNNFVIKDADSKNLGRDYAEAGNRISWTKINKDFVKLRQLADDTSRFLSPLFFAFLTVNVTSVVMNLDQSLNPSPVMFRRQWPYYIYVSLWHFVIRTVLVIHYGSMVYMNSDETLDLIEAISESEENWPMERLLGMLRRKPVGVTFFGTFFITRKLFISILSFVFTIEIMILQASSNASSTTKND